MSIVRFSILSAALGFCLGCGSNVDPAPKASEAAFKGTTADDKQLVTEILQKEGIQGDIVSLFKGETAYEVSVGQTPTPGKRASPTPPRSYTIDIATKKVTKGM